MGRPSSAAGQPRDQLLDIIEERPWIREQLPDVDQCVVPPMRLMLIAGFNQHDRPRHWILISIDGELTTDPLHACLFNFTAKGSELAFVAARKCTDVVGRDCRVVAFVARVLVTGDPAAPDAVVEAWRFEDGDQPMGRSYPFDREP